MSDETTETQSETTTETQAEAEKRTRRTYPIRVFAGSAREGWRLCTEETFSEERDAARWVREHGEDGASYLLARPHVALTVQPRQVVVAQV